MDHDLDAEKTLAVTLVTDPAAWDYVADLLAPAMFGSDMARAVFEGVRAVVQASKPIEPVTVQAAMVAAGRPGSAIPKWTTAPRVTTAAALALAKRVRELWARRTLRLAASDALANAGERESGETIAELAAVLESVQTGGESKAQPIGRLVFDWLRELQAEAKDPNSRPVFYDTGFKAFDKATGGLARGELSVFGARPGNGKSSWVVAIATNFALRKIPVGLFWLEDDWRDASRRFIARRFQAEAWRLRGQAKHALQYVTSIENLVDRSDVPLYVDDAHGLTITDIQARMRRMAREHGVRVFVLDHLGEVRIEKDERWGDRHDLALGRVARMYRDTAKELGAVPILISQMNRRIEQRGADSIPQMSDLDGSGQVEQAARLIAFAQLHRDDKLETTGTGALHIVKATGGQTGTVPLRWSKQSMTWEEGA